jgi:hypothetical protein
MPRKPKDVIGGKYLGRGRGNGADHAWTEDTPVSRRRIEAERERNRELAEALAPRPAPAPHRERRP